MGVDILNTLEFRDDLVPGGTDSLRAREDYRRSGAAARGERQLVNGVSKSPLYNDKGEVVGVKTQTERWPS